MVSLRVLSTLLFCSLSNAHALAFAPVQTDIGAMGPLAAVPANRMEPRAPEPTAAPNPHWVELQKRSYTVTIGEALIAPDNTLGYYTSAGYTNRWGAYTCGRLGTAVLVFPNTVNSADGYFACCYTGQCTFAKTCIDSSAYFTKSACDAACLADTATYRCTGYGSSYCNLLTFSGIGVSLWACADETSDHIQLFTTSAGQTGRVFKTTNLVVTPTGTPPPSPTPTTGSASSGGLSEPAKIGVGVGAGVGGVLAIAGVIAILFKTGVFSAAGAGIAGGVAGAAAAGGAAASGGAGGAGGAGANGAPGGDMTQIGKMGYYGYTPGGEATNFAQPPPGYTPSGAEVGNFTAPGGPTGAENFTQGGAGGTGMGGYGPTGTEFGSQGAAPMSGYGGPTGAEGANFTAPGGPTGAEGANLTAPGNPGFGPTGAEAGNFTASGGAPGGPPGTFGGAGVPPGVAPGASPLNPAYFVAPAAAVPLAAGAALLGRRKEVGSPVSAAGSSTSPQMQPSQYATPNSQYASPNNQYELSGGGVYRGAELATPESSYVSPQSTEMGSYVSPQSTGMGSPMGSYNGHVSEMGTPSSGYAPPSGPPPRWHQDVHEMASSTVSGPSELEGYYDQHGQPQRQ